MTFCSIIQCRARKNVDQPHLTFHRFPRNQVLQQKWLKVIGEENIKTGLKVPRICSLHFSDSSFNRTLDVLRLRDDAVPSVHLMPFKKTHEPVMREMKSVKEQSLPEKTQPTTPVKEMDPISEEIESEGMTSDSSEETMPNPSRPLVHYNQSKFIKMQEMCNSQKKKIKRLEEKIRRRDRKISSMQNIIDNLRNKGVIIISME